MPLKVFVKESADIELRDFKILQRLLGFFPSPPAASIGKSEKLLCVKPGSPNSITRKKSVGLSFGGDCRGCRRAWRGDLPSEPVFGPDSISPQRGTGEPENFGPAKQRQEVTDAQATAAYPTRSQWPDEQRDCVYSEFV
jgi:hypothetical protein